MYDDQEEEEEAPGDGGGVTKAFAVVQSRKFMAVDLPTNCQLASLCPSMDLVIVESPASAARSSGGGGGGALATSRTSSSSTSSSSSSSSLVIYRTMSWQKVATITPMNNQGEDEEGDIDHDDAAEDGTSFGDNFTFPVSFGWSPNGQWVAVARHRHVALYGIEALANPMAVHVSGEGGTTTNTTAADGGDASDDNGGPTHAWTVKHAVQSLHWAHVGRNHPTASVQSRVEVEREVSWRYQSRYVDQSTKFLPPSGYYHSSESDEAMGVGGGYGADEDGDYTITNALAECKTPLSVLCVATSRNFELYLHGQYPLLTLPRGKGLIAAGTSPSPVASPSPKSTLHPLPSIVASNDLSYWLMSGSEPASAGRSDDNEDNNMDNHCLHLYHMPFLKRDRYALQQVAAFHTSVLTHLATLKRSVTEVANNWKTSLKPLDQKLQPLLRLLSNYGVDVELANGRLSAALLRNVLKDYILMGHTGHSTSIANAMDQYFTGVQMNDQLLQRMERSLHASIANVETAAIVGIVRPSQALGWQIQELSGLVRSFDKDDAGNDASPKALLLSELAEANEELWIGAQQLQTCIVNSRLAIRDFCGWLRHAGSQVKARGTAPNSVQRENARKRRVTQAVLERIVSSLLNSKDADNANGIGTPTAGGGTFSSFAASISPAASTKHAGLAESLLNLKVTELLRDMATDKVPMGGDKNGIGCPSSPSSVTTSLLRHSSKLPTSLHRTMEATKAVFSNPLSNIRSRLVSKEIYLPRSPDNENTLVATHSRIGRERPLLDDGNNVWDSDDDEEGEGGQRSYFLPRVAKHYYAHLPSTGLDTCRQWFVIAQAQGSTVQLFALPVGWKPHKYEKDPGYTYGDIEDDDDDDLEDIVVTGFYLTSKLNLSTTDGEENTTTGKMLQLGFYGDDGKSALSSGHDSGTGKEGRQKLGLLYERYGTMDGESASSSIELWTFPYDSACWQVLPFDSMLVNSSHVDDSCCKRVVPEQSTDKEEEAETGEDSVLHAQVRKITESSDLSTNSWLFLSGSRGVGGVAMMSKEGIVSLDLLDLEDCEEEEGEDEEGFQ